MQEDTPFMSNENLNVDSNVKAARLQEVTCPVTGQIYREPIKLIPQSKDNEPYVESQLVTLEKATYERLWRNSNTRICPITQAPFASGMKDWEMIRRVTQYLQDFPEDSDLQYSSYPIPQRHNAISIGRTTQRTFRTTSSTLSTFELSLYEYIRCYVCRPENWGRVFLPIGGALLASAFSVFNICMGAIILGYDPEQLKIRENMLATALLTMLIILITIRLDDNEQIHLYGLSRHQVENHAFLLLLCINVVLSAGSALLSNSYTFDDDDKTIGLPKTLGALTLGATAMSSAIGFLGYQCKKANQLINSSADHLDPESNSEHLELGTTAEP